MELFFMVSVFLYYRPTADAPEKSGQFMIITGLNCCSKLASISCPDLSGNVCKEFKYFNVHAT